MLWHKDRQRTGKAGVWFVVALLGIAGFMAYYLTRPPADAEHYEGDEARLQKLQNAALAADDPQDAKDWPQWRGPRRDGISRETGFLTEWPAAGPPVLWRAKTGLGYSTVAVSGGRVYTLVQDGAEEAVVCWDAETGSEKWRRRYPASYKDQYPGPRSTPTLSGGKVYTVGGTGIFHCLDAGSGEVVWRVDLVKQHGAVVPKWGIAFSPLVDGDRVYAHLGGDKGKSAAAFHKDTGKILWSALDDPAGYSSPMRAKLAGKEQVLFFTGKALAGLSPDDGTVYWGVPWTTPLEVNAATPIVAGDYVFIASDYGKGCALLEIFEEGGKPQAKPVYSHNRMRNHFSTCVLYKDHLYGFDDDLFACMEFRTGKIVWKQRGFGKGSVLVAGGMLIVLGDNGKLSLAETSPEAYREKATFAVSPRKCWTVPVLANGRLYVRDEEELVCLDLRKATK